MPDLERVLHGEADLAGVERLLLGDGALDRVADRGVEAPPRGPVRHREVAEPAREVHGYHFPEAPPPPKLPPPPEKPPPPKPPPPPPKPPAEPAPRPAAPPAAEAARAPAGHEREEHREESEPDPDRQEAREHPCDHEHEAAGEERAEHAAEDRTQHARGDRHADHHEREPVLEAAAQVRTPGGLGLGRRQGLPVDHREHAVHARVDPAREVAVAETRDDRLVDDAVRDEVGERTLEAAAHLDAQRPVLFGDEQERAVVRGGAAELPSIHHADAVLLDRLRLGGRHDQDRHLRALLGLEGRELLLERRALRVRERAGEIRDARAQLGNRLEREGRAAGEPDRESERSAAGARERSAQNFTSGGFAISCSFSTVKFGFTEKPKTIAVRLVGNLRTVPLKACTDSM